MPPTSLENLKPLRSMTNSSEIRDELFEKIIRESTLAGIAWHRHLHECHKALGLPTDETPLSVVPETLFEDFDFEAPLSSSDEGFRAPSEPSGGDGHGDGETAMAMEDDGVKVSFRPGVEEMLRILLPRYFDLGISTAAHVSLDAGSPIVEAQIEKMMDLEEFGKKEFLPGVEEMLQILLPRYFDLVRSFLILIPLGARAPLHLDVPFVLAPFL